MLKIKKMKTKLMENKRNAKEKEQKAQKSLSEYTSKDRNHRAERV